MNCVESNVICDVNKTKQQNFDRFVYHCVFKVSLSSNLYCLFLSEGNSDVLATSAMS